MSDEPPDIDAQVAGLLESAAEAAAARKGEVPPIIPEEPPLELESISTARVPLTREPEPPAPAERRLRRKRILEWTVLLAVLFAAAYLAVSFRPALLEAEKEKAFYTFTDEQGVVHIVDELDKVPQKYRARAKKSP